MFLKTQIFFGIIQLEPTQSPPGNTHKLITLKGNPIFPDRFTISLFLLLVIDEEN